MKKYQTVNPATEKVLAEYSYFSNSEIETALEKAQSSFARWRQAPIETRRKLLQEISKSLKANSEKLALCVTEEMGKPIKDSTAEVLKSATACDYYAEHMSDFLQKKVIFTDFKKSWVSYHPLGPLLGIMPWNFPFWQAFRFLAPALAAGNVILLKHSEITSKTAIYLEEVIQGALMATDPSYEKTPVFQNLRMDHEQSAQVIADSRIKAVSFTGSTRGGKEVAVECAKNLKKSLLELGGSDAYIVLEDANWASTIKNCVASRLVNNGQSCVAGKRFIVPEKQTQKFIGDFLDEMTTYKMASPLDQKTQLGPLAHEKFLKSLRQELQKMKALSGIQVLESAHQVPDVGYYLNPQIIYYEKNHKSFFEEEFFGPVGLIHSYRTVEEAFELANKADYGLGGGIYSTQEDLALNLVEQNMEAGFVVVNSFVKSDARLPFGGVKHSGYGRELGPYGFYEFVNIKTVAVGKS